jgi:hypothetical protein
MSLSSRNIALATFFVLTILFLSQPCTSRKNHDIPHPHQGVLSSYEPGPFQSLDLNKGDEKELESGKPVMKQNRGSELAGGAICVQDVDAPKAAVWSQILDLDSYKGKVPKVNECKNYVVKQNQDGTTTLKTKMVVGVIPGYAVRSRSNCAGTTITTKVLFRISFFSHQRFFVIFV